MTKLTSGAMAWGAASAGVKSAMRLHIYRRATAILDVPRPKRLAMLDKEPETLRPLIKAEVVRVHAMRRE